MDIDKVASIVHEQFQSRTYHNRPLLIGVDGLGGAGKTTFVEEVKRKLKEEHCLVEVIYLDDHIVEKEKRYDTGHPEWYEYVHLQWDSSELVNCLFTPLHQGNCLNLPFYDKVTDSITYKKMDVLANRIVLIEGIFLQRNEWRQFFDSVIFLNCPFEVRKERVLTRDAYIGNDQERLKKYTERYWPGEQHYLETIDPINRADLVIHI